MKKIYNLFVILTLIILVIILSGCKKQTPNIDQYKIDQYEVTFITNSDTFIKKQVVEKGKKITEPTTPIKEGYSFKGWYLGDEKWSFIGYVVTEDITLVAKWEKIKEELTVELYKENGQSYVDFGRYPQTVVTDNEIINALSKISKTNEFGYIEYNGNEYKKVVANPEDTSYKFINGNKITKGKTYYFLVEPIKWRVLKESNGTCKLLCEMIIDNTEFYESTSRRKIKGQTIYPDNYEYSNIRAWLNGYNGTSYDVEDYTNKGFYDIAFTEEEKKLINNNSNDKVYLLSYSDTLNTNYGFSSDYYEDDIERRAQVSDYARSKDCWMSMETDYYGNGIWWLRSPCYNSSYYQSYYVRVVRSDGYVYYDYVCDSNYGVRPALTITI